MAALNRIRLHIAGGEYTLTTDEPEDYVNALARTVDEHITAALAADGRVSAMMAAVLTCLDLADEAGRCLAGSRPKDLGHDPPLRPGLRGKKVSSYGTMAGKRLQRRHPGVCE